MALGVGIARVVAAMGRLVAFSVLLVACSGAPRSDVTAVVDGGGGLRADGSPGVADASVADDNKKDDAPPADAFVAPEAGDTSADSAFSESAPTGESGSADAIPFGDAAGGGDGPEGVTADGESDEARGPSFGIVYQTVFQPSCITGCHTAATPMGNLDLSTQDGAYASLVGVLASGPACASIGEKRVVAGNPAMSLLYTKMVDLEDCGGPMPASPLDPGSVNLVREWIANGAAR
jgi:hypothetical protein